MERSVWLQHPGLALTLIALGFMLAVGLVAWVLGEAAARVPEEDRQYKDPPPWGFRLGWWPIQWLAHYLDVLLSAPRREAMAARLRKAGLDYALKPAQFLAARLLCALVVMAPALWGLLTVVPGHQAPLLQALPREAQML